MCRRNLELARNSRLWVCVNRKVATTAADGNEQGDVQAIEFGMIPGYDDLVWDVSLVCDRISRSTQHGLNSKRWLPSCSGSQKDCQIQTWLRYHEHRSYLQFNLSLSRFVLNYYVACGWWLTCRRLIWSISISWEMRMILEVSVPSGVELAQHVSHHPQET